MLLYKCALLHCFDKVNGLYRMYFACLVVMEMKQIVGIIGHLFRLKHQLGLFWFSILKRLSSLRMSMGDRKQIKGKTV